MSFFEKFFNGEIKPEAWTPDSEEYRRRLKESSSLSQALTQDLTEKQVEMFNLYMDNHVEMDIMMQVDIFQKAFLLGVQMQMELQKLEKKKEI